MAQELGGFSYEVGLTLDKNIKNTIQQLEDMLAGVNLNLTSNINFSSFTKATESLAKISEQATVTSLEIGKIENAFKNASEAFNSKIDFGTNFGNAANEMMKNISSLESALSGKNVSKSGITDIINDIVKSVDTAKAKFTESKGLSDSLSAFLAGNGVKNTEFDKIVGQAERSLNGISVVIENIRNAVNKGGGADLTKALPSVAELNERANAVYSFIGAVEKLNIAKEVVARNENGMKSVSLPIIPTIDVSKVDFSELKNRIDAVDLVFSKLRFDESAIHNIQEQIKKVPIILENAQIDFSKLKIKDELERIVTDLKSIMQNGGNGFYDAVNKGKDNILKNTGLSGEEVNKLVAQINESLEKVVLNIKTANLAPNVVSDIESQLRNVKLVIETAEVKNVQMPSVATQAPSGTIASVTKSTSEQEKKSLTDVIAAIEQLKTAMAGNKPTAMFNTEQLEQFRAELTKIQTELTKIFETISGFGNGSGLLRGIAEIKEALSSPLAVTSATTESIQKQASAEEVASLSAQQLNEQYQKLNTTLAELSSSLNLVSESIKKLFSDNGVFTMTSQIENLVNTFKNAADVFAQAGGNITFINGAQGVEQMTTALTKMEEMVGKVDTALGKMNTTASNTSTTTPGKTPTKEALEDKIGTLLERLRSAENKDIRGSFIDQMRERLQKLQNELNSLNGDALVAKISEINNSFKTLSQQVTSSISDQRWFNKNASKFGFGSDSGYYSNNQAGAHEQQRRQAEKEAEDINMWAKMFEAAWKKFYAAQKGVLGDGSQVGEFNPLNRSFGAFLNNKIVQDFIYQMNNVARYSDSILNKRNMGLLNGVNSNEAAQQLERLWNDMQKMLFDGNIAKMQNFLKNPLLLKNELAEVGAKIGREVTTDKGLQNFEKQNAELKKLRDDYTNTINQVRNKTAELGITISTANINKENTSSRQAVKTQWNIYLKTLEKYAGDLEMMERLLATSKRKIENLASETRQATTADRGITIDARNLQREADEFTKNQEKIRRENQKTTDQRKAEADKAAKEEEDALNRVMRIYNAAINAKMLFKSGATKTSGSVTVDVDTRQPVSTINTLLIKLDKLFNYSGKELVLKVDEAKANGLFDAVNLAYKQYSKAGSDALDKAKQMNAGKVVDSKIEAEIAKEVKNEEQAYQKLAAAVRIAEGEISKLVQMRDKMLVNNPGADLSLITGQIQYLQSSRLQPLLDAMSAPKDVNVANSAVEKFTSETLAFEQATNRAVTAQQALNKETVKTATESAKAAEKEERDAIKLNSQTSELIRRRNELNNIKDVRSSEGKSVTELEKVIALYNRYIESIDRAKKAGVALNVDNIANYSKRLQQMTSDANRNDSHTDRMSSGWNNATQAQKQFDSQTLQTLKSITSLDQQFSMLAMNIQNAFSIIGLQQFAQEIIHIGGELEKQKLAMGSIFGSERDAEAIYNKVATMSMYSPFTVQDLVKNTKQLSAFGVEYDKLYDTTKRLSDIAAAVGVDFGRISYEYGQMESMGYLDRRHLRMFSMSGIPLAAELKKYYSNERGEEVTTHDIDKMIMKRQISAEVVKSILQDMTNEGGKFFNMQEIMAESLASKYANLENAMNIMYGRLAEGTTGDWLKGLAETLTELAENYEKVATSITTLTIAFTAAKTLASYLAMANQESAVAVMSNALATKGLTAEQAKSIVVKKAIMLEKKELVAATYAEVIANGSLSKSQAVALIATSGLEEAEKKALLTRVGLTEVDAAYIASLNGASAATIRFKMALIGVNNAIEKNALIIAAVAVGALVARYINLRREATALKDEITDLENKMSNSYAESAAELNRLIKKLNDENLSLTEKKKTLDTLKSKYGEYLGNLKLEGDSYDQIADAANRAKEAILGKIKAQMNAQLQEDKITAINKNSEETLNDNRKKTRELLSDELKRIGSNSSASNVLTEIESYLIDGKSIADIEKILKNQLGSNFDIKNLTSSPHFWEGSDVWGLTGLSAVYTGRRKAIQDINNVIGHDPDSDTIDKVVKYYDNLKDAVADGNEKLRLEQRKQEKLALIKSTKEGTLVNYGIDGDDLFVKALGIRADSDNYKSEAEKVGEELATNWKTIANKYFYSGKKIVENEGKKYDLTSAIKSDLLYGNEDDRSAYFKKLAEEREKLKTSISRGEQFVAAEKKNKRNADNDTLRDLARDKEELRLINEYEKEIGVNLDSYKDSKKSTSTKQDKTEQQRIQNQIRLVREAYSEYKKWYGDLRNVDAAKSKVMDSSIIEELFNSEGFGEIINKENFSPQSIKNTIAEIRKRVEKAFKDNKIKKEDYNNLMLNLQKADEEVDYEEFKNLGEKAANEMKAQIEKELSNFNVYEKLLEATGNGRIDIKGSSVKAWDELSKSWKKDLDNLMIESGKDISLVNWDWNDEQAEAFFGGKGKLLTLYLDIKKRIEQNGINALSDVADQYKNALSENEKYLIERENLERKYREKRGNAVDEEVKKMIDSIYRVDVTNLEIRHFKEKSGNSYMLANLDSISDEMMNELSLDFERLVYTLGSKVDASEEIRNELEELSEKIQNARNGRNNADGFGTGWLSGIKNAKNEVRIATKFVEQARLNLSRAKISGDEKQIKHAQAQLNNSLDSQDEKIIGVKNSWKNLFTFLTEQGKEGGFLKFAGSIANIFSGKSQKSVLEERLKRTTNKEEIARIKKDIEAADKEIEKSARGTLASGLLFASTILDGMVESMKELAEATGDVDLSEQAGQLAAFSQNLQSAGQGAQSGGWIGAIIGGASDMINQTVQSFAVARAEVAELEQNTKDFARAMQLLNLTLDPKKFKSVFAEDSIGKTAEAYKKAKEALEAYGETVGKTSKEVKTKTEFDSLGTAIFAPVLGWFGFGQSVSNETKTIRGALSKGYSDLQAMAVKTKDYSGWANFWGKQDKYTALKDLAPQLWDENNELNVKAAKEFLNTNTQISEEQRKQIQHVVDLKEKYDEMIDEIHSQLEEWFGSWGSDMSDAVFDSIINGTKAWEEFEKIGTESVLNIGKAMMNSSIFQSYFKQFEKDMENAWGTDDPTGELLKISGRIFDGLPKVLDTAKLWGENWIERMKAEGFDPAVLSDNSKSASSSIKSTTEETADILAAYINAIRQDVSIERALFEQLIDYHLPTIESLLEGSSNDGITEYMDTPYITSAQLPTGSYIGQLPQIADISYDEMLTKANEMIDSLMFSNQLPMLNATAVAQLAQLNMQTEYLRVIQDNTAANLNAVDQIRSDIHSVIYGGNKINI